MSLHEQARLPHLAKGSTPAPPHDDPHAAYVMGGSGGRKLTRNEKLSQRILASLSHGGKLPPPSRAGQRPAFHVEAKNVGEKQRAIIRRRLGLAVEDGGA